MSTFLAAHINDRDYFPLLSASLENARSKIWVCLFLFDIRPERDIHGQALDLAMTLIERRQAGVDVRVLLTGQVKTPVLGVANVATGIFLESHGVPHRRVFDVDGQRKGTHAKFVICDDHAMLGSQNWTDDGFNENLEDGVILHGSPVTQLGFEFSTLWDNGLGLPNYDVT